MKCIINFFKKLLGYCHEECPVFLPVPEEHQIMVNEEKACELQENLDVVEIESEEPVCLCCGKVNSQCECEKDKAAEICPDCASEQCTCEKEEKVEEPVKKKRRGRPRKKQNKNKE